MLLAYRLINMKYSRLGCNFLCIFYCLILHDVYEVIYKLNNTIWFF